MLHYNEIKQSVLLKQHGTHSTFLTQRQKNEGYIGFVLPNEWKNLNATNIIKYC